MDNNNSGDDTPGTIKADRPINDCPPAESKENLKTEKRILNLSLAGSIAFLLSEIIFAIITGSKAVLMDCVYDIADLIMIGPFLLLVPLLYKPVTEKRPYGFSQVESLFVMIKYFFLLGVDVFLIVDCLQTIIAGGNNVHASLIAIFELAISAGCVAMYIVLKRLQKKYSSPSIKAELFIWKLDAMSTLGVGVAFIIKLILDHTSISFIGPYVDPGIAILLALILAKEPILMIIQSLRSLVLFAPESDVFNKVEKICESRLEQDNCTITFTDVIKTGRKIWVNIYFSSSVNLIDISRLKAAHNDIRSNLIDEFETVEVELIPDMDEGFSHVEPASDPLRRKDKLNYIEEQEQKKNVKATKKARKQSTRSEE